MRSYNLLPFKRSEAHVFSRIYLKRALPSTTSLLNVLNRFFALFSVAIFTEYAWGYQAHPGPAAFVRKRSQVTHPCPQRCVLGAIVSWPRILNLVSWFPGFQGFNSNTGYLTLTTHSRRPQKRPEKRSALSIWNYTFQALIFSGRVEFIGGVKSFHLDGYIQIYDFAGKLYQEKNGACTENKRIMFEQHGIAKIKNTLQ